MAANIEGISAGLRKSLRHRSERDLRNREGVQNLVNAQNLKKMLLQQYEGHSLDDVFSGAIASNSYGEFYEIRSQNSMIFSKPDHHHAISLLSRSLPVLYGIRSKIAKKLIKQGYETIQDLTCHPRWKFNALEVVKLIRDQNSEALIELYGQRFGNSHPLLLATSAFPQTQDFRVIDIETLGFPPSPLFLIGIANLTPQELDVRQILAQDLADEPAVVGECLKEFTTSSAILSFNGRSFDIPYILGRIAYYGLPKPPINLHFDLLHFSRRYWRNKVANCKLGTLEREILAVKRVMDLPSSLVPAFYQSYLKEQNPGPLVPIINHNRQDLISLVEIFNLLCKGIKLTSKSEIISRP
ncbi:MAG: ribonuclease H-like domain-containing protein [Candidatus Hodarchaeota archaeon]